jgi:hypothetical protein
VKLDPGTHNRMHSVLTLKLGDSRGEAGDAGCLQWPMLKELHCSRFEGADYRRIEEGRGGRLMGK